eukprot:1186838-Prorocentrum_minimum.AAC.2
MCGPLPGITHANSRERGALKLVQWEIHGSWFHELGTGLVELLGMWTSVTKTWVTPGYDPRFGYCRSHSE